MALLNALSPKETIAQLHLLLLCVKLRRTITHSQLLLEQLQQDLSHMPTIPITLSFYQCLLTPFEILTDEQVVALMFLGLYTPRVPTCSVNDMLRKKQLCMFFQAAGARQVVTHSGLDKV